MIRSNTFESRYYKWRHSPQFIEVLKIYDRKEMLPYHNLTHILRCISLLTDNRLIEYVTDELKFSIIFHDIVYDPKSSINEENSAAVMKSYLQKYYTDDLGMLEKIASMIISTKHRKCDGDLDDETKVLLDVDLEILSSNKEDYREYADGIRKEFSFVSDDDFSEKRIKFLESILSRSKIYHFLTDNEEQARTNIKNEILRLSREF